jgi:glycosyltransferase involved in cell wall biosynthesis
MRTKLRANNERSAVLFVWENLSCVGGVDTFLLHCLQRLPACGLQPFLLDVGSRPQLDQFSAFSDYVINAPELSNANQNIRTTGFEVKMRELGIEAVVLNEWVYGRIALDLPTEVPVVAICHVDSDDDKYFLTAKVLSDRVDAIVGVSETICKKLKASLPLRRRSIVRRIYCGVESAAVRQKWVGDRPLELVYIGRIQQQQKRIFDIVPFVDALNSNGVNCVINLIGEGESADELLNKLSERSGRVKIRFVGPLLHREAMRQLECQDIYLLFSEFEGLPISLLEALARGVVPVVSQVSSGISEILRDSVNARTFPIGRPELAAKIIAELAQDPTRLERLSRAAKGLGDNFAIDKMFASYAELLWATIKRGRRKRFLLGPSRLATALRKLNSLTREPYELYGRSLDGWMAPSGIIRVLDPKSKILTLNLEIPGWLPFTFPVSIKAILDDRPIAILKVSAPGNHDLNVPLTRPGIIELSADQWFVPKELGVSPDTRLLCYRVNRARIQQSFGWS